MPVRPPGRGAGPFLCARVPDFGLVVNLPVFRRLNRRRLEDLFSDASVHLQHFADPHRPVFLRGLSRSPSQTARAIFPLGYDSLLTGHKRHWNWRAAGTGKPSTAFLFSSDTPRQFARSLGGLSDVSCRRHPPCDCRTTPRCPDPRLHSHRGSGMCK